jgi:putative ABC transport system permease protein
MKILVKMAWRNIWRYKRRTFLTLAAIAFAVAISVFMRGLQKGTYEQMIENVIRINTGYLQIHRKGFWDDRTLQYAFKPDSSLWEILSSQPHVTSFAPRAESDGLASAGENTNGVLVIGINPQAEAKGTTLKERIQKGKFLSPETPQGAIIGEELAKNLQTNLHDKITLLVQGYDGSLNAGIYQVEGIIRTGAPELDRSVVFLNLEAAQELFWLDGRISEILVFVDHISNLKKVSQGLKSKLDLKNYEVMTWDELMPELVQLIAFDNASGQLFLILLVVVVAFGILNTILMSVFERIKEFGVMMALGVKPNRIVGLVFIESTFLSSLGVIIGNIVGFGLSLYFLHHPISLSESLSRAMEQIGFTAKFFVKPTFSTFLEVTIAVFAVSLVMTIYPTIKATRFRPVEALRHI